MVRQWLNCAYWTFCCWPTNAGWAGSQTEMAMSISVKDVEGAYIHILIVFGVKLGTVESDAKLALMDPYLLH